MREQEKLIAEVGRLPSTGSTILVSPKWKKCKGVRHTTWFPNTGWCQDSVIERTDLVDLTDSHKLLDFLESENCNFAGIIETEKEIIGIVDKIRSIPIFFVASEDVFLISNSATLLRSKMQVSKCDKSALMEFVSGGYVTGGDTLFSEIRQIQAGEFIRADKQTGRVTLRRYFRYCPDLSTNQRHERLQIRLGEILDEIFSDIATTFRDRPIFVPLSGGLDSRLVVAKLHEHGCRDVRTFSYGNSGNYEAKIARHVATTLGIPWQFIPNRDCTTRNGKPISRIKEYWQYADGCSSMPAMSGFAGTSQLVERELVPPDALIINGQSGDFISGGHVPEAGYQDLTSGRAVIDAIVFKHFSLWETPPINIDFQIIRGRIRNQLQISEETKFDLIEGVSMYEMWEYEERQAKFVVNGQRLYDWLGIDWLLPLWDGRLIEFWREMPLGLKLGQALYKQYLKSYNYQGLFFESDLPNVRHWTVSERFLQTHGKFVSMFGLKRVGHRLEKLSGYWGKYGYQYSIYGLGELWENIDLITSPPQARGVMALGVKKWLEEDVHKVVQIEGN